MVRMCREWWVVQRLSDSKSVVLSLPHWVWRQAAMELEKETGN